MANKKAPKRLADQPMRIVGRLSAKQRSEHARTIEQVEEKLGALGGDFAEAKGN